MGEQESKARNEKLRQWLGRDTDVPMPQPAQGQAVQGLPSVTGASQHRVQMTEVTHPDDRAARDHLLRWALTKGD